VSQRRTASQSTIHISSSSTSALQYFLLHFVDENEYLIVPEDKIKEIVDGQAVLLNGRKRKIGRIEAQGESNDFLSTMSLIYSEGSRTVCQQMLSEIELCEQFDRQVILSITSYLLSQQRVRSMIVIVSWNSTMKSTTVNVIHRMDETPMQQSSVMVSETRALFA
jgi:regulator of replication initiation timing